MAILTIGIPAYNEERYVAKTINSLIRQTFTDFRVIIADNCSSDRSYEIAKQYEDTDKRIEVIKHQKNIGSLNNFKYILQLANTKYFVWLQAHDVFLDDYLKRAIEFLENNPSVIMVYPQSVLIDPNDIIMRDTDYADSNIDTRGLSLREGLLKIGRELCWCTSFHGVFQTTILKKLPLEPMIGTDHLLLFMAALYGDICMLDMIGIQRRQIKIETPEEWKKRWELLGVYKESPGLNPYALMTRRHIEHLWKYPRISVKEKMIISFGIIRIFSKRFGITWRDFNIFQDLRPLSRFKIRETGNNDFKDISR